MRFQDDDTVFNCKVSNADNQVKASSNARSSSIRLLYKKKVLYVFVVVIFFIVFYILSLNTQTSCRCSTDARFVGDGTSLKVLRFAAGTCLQGALKS